MAKDVYTVDDLRNAWPAATAGEPAPVRLTVIGDPVAHSRSPQMHNPALESENIPARYARLHVTPHELKEALRLMPQRGFIGTNVTIPHKAATMALMDKVDPRARQAGGVNTVVVQDDRLVGHSTDGPGFSAAIRDDFGADLRDLRVMILGAGGGAGRAIALQCANERVPHLTLVNRTLEKSQRLAAELRPMFGCETANESLERVQAVPWDTTILARELGEVDLIVNATPLGMARDNLAISPIPATLLTPHHLVYDTVYTSGQTPLIAAAQAAGAHAANGLSMLLHQGALSFEIWFNRPAPLEIMRTALLRS